MSAAGNNPSGIYLDGINFTDTEHFSAQGNAFTVDVHSTDFESSFDGGDELTIDGRSVFDDKPLRQRQLKLF